MDTSIAEIERASRDRSWETGRRRAARLLYEGLNPLGLVLSPDLGLAWSAPAWDGDGVALMFQHIIRAPRFEIRQQMLRLTSMLDDQDQAAEDMAQQLLSTYPDAWAGSLGSRPGRPAPRSLSILSAGRAPCNSRPAWRADAGRQRSH